MRLYIIRHADPDYANRTITPIGHKEAAALADWVAAERITRIFCSPLGRAIDTMQYSADRLGLTPEIQDWMQEISNFAVTNDDGERYAAWNLHGEQVRGEEPWPTPDNWHEDPPLDDPKFRSTYEALKASSDAFLASLGYVRKGGRYRIERANRDRVAVFCHGGFGLTWLAHLLELSLPLVWTGFFLVPSSVTTILFDERSDEFAVPRCLALAQTAHLYQAGLPVQPRGIVANFD